MESEYGEIPTHERNTGLFELTGHQGKKFYDSDQSGSRSLRSSIVRSTEDKEENILR